MLKKYCAICLGEGLADFDSVLDLAHEPGTKIGRMDSPTVLIASFISTFSQFELYELFKGSDPKNFLLMEVGEHTIHMNKEDVQNILLDVFKDMDILNDNKIESTIEKEFTLQVKNMSPDEKQDRINDILDTLPDITAIDKIKLEILSR